MIKERESNFELLRIFSIFGIVCMHSFGSVAEHISGLNQSIYLLINGIFDTGVTCFILISGYYGIKFSVKKLAMLAMMVLFYSLFGLGCSYIMGESINVEDVVKSFVPILSRKYWFISCYFWLAALTPFINKIPENLSRKSFEKLLGLMLLLFSIIPTFLYFEIMQDSGRGMAHMILIYLIGRYLRIYMDENIVYVKNRNPEIIFTLSVGVTWGINWILTLASGKYFAPFTRNCSLTIIISSISLFFIFKKIKTQNKWINILASNVLAVYIFERTARGMISQYIFSLQDYVIEWYFVFIVFLYTGVVVILCMLIEAVRKRTLEKIVSPAAGAAERWAGRAYVKIVNLLGWG